MLQTEYQKVIHKTRYARWIDGENRREDWEETVTRYFNFFEDHLKKNNDYTLRSDTKDELKNAVMSLAVMPSMRALMTAGPALERDNVACFNCSYLPVNSPRSFDEALYILMCGVGVGFSVERQYISKLPEVNEHFEKSNTTIVVEDSKAGWARALRELISLLYNGQIPKWDTTKLREAGARLKTFGGRSSGPEPLEDLFNFLVDIFVNAAGRKLTSLECHDIMCKIGDVVVVGGVRRSALISLSNLSDDRMRSAKAGQWWERYGYRKLANNSACYTEKPDMGAFMREWESLYSSKSGERGIFNRYGAKKIVERIGRRDPEHEWGCNPCSEIILRPFQFCNLTEVVVRADDDLETLKKKVRQATILGTFQASLTNFKYLRKIWKDNTEEEALLGVSLTGVFSNPFLNGSHGEEEMKKWLTEMGKVAVDTNKEWAKRLGINQATAIMCNKPSGTVSQLVNCPSGIHAGYAPFYIRRIRQDTKDPVTQFMIEMGFPYEPDVTAPNNTMVFSFPMMCEPGTLVTKDLDAIKHMELWLAYQNFWCEHKPSVTISVKENEWMDVGAWVWRNFDVVSGISFLPYSEHTYRQAPYEEISEEKYKELMSNMPKGIDWTKLAEYEKEDNTVGSQELACHGGACDI